MTDRSGRARAVDLARKLLAQAEDPAATPQERQTFAAKAAEIMLRHDLTEAVVRAATTPGRAAEPVDAMTYRVSGAGGHGRHRAFGLGDVAQAYGCEICFFDNDASNQPRTLHIVGTVTDLDTLKLLLPILAAAAETSAATATAHHRQQLTGEGWYTKAELDRQCLWYRRSYLRGFGTGVAHQIRSRRQDVIDEIRATGTGADLVLADRTSRVAAEFRPATPSSACHGRSAATHPRAATTARPPAGRWISAAIGSAPPAGAPCRRRHRRADHRPDAPRRHRSRRRPTTRSTPAHPGSPLPHAEPAPAGRPMPQHPQRDYHYASPRCDACPPPRADRRRARARRPPTVEDHVRTSSLHTATDLATRALAVLTVAGLAILAGTISYRHMVLLAERSGMRGIDAHAFPLCVDGLDLIGVLVLLADRRAGRRSGTLPWIVLTIGTLASIAANVAVAPNNPIARAISGWSAIALLAAAKMLAHLFEPADAVKPQRHLSIVDSTVLAVAPVAESTLPVRGQQRRRGHGDAARRIPTSPDAYARWCAIWTATRHEPAATREVASRHRVSLRTLQFIRAAGEAGLLTPAPNQHHPTTAPRAALPPDAPTDAQQPPVLADTR